MRVLKIFELMRLTRLESLALLREVATALVALPELSRERANALINLCKINRVLARPNAKPD